MKIKIVQHEDLITERARLMHEAERLLNKIAKLSTLYHGKLYKIRKKIIELERHIN